MKLVISIQLKDDAGTNLGGLKQTINPFNSANVDTTWYLFNGQKFRALLQSLGLIADGTIVASTPPDINI